MGGLKFNVNQVEGAQIKGNESKGLLSLLNASDKQVLRAKVTANQQAESAYPKSEKFEDDYKVIRKLGSGAQAQVFECIHRFTKETCAVKVFRQRQSDGKREARYLRRVQSHPNVIAYKDKYEAEDNFSLVMECGQMDILEYVLNHSVQSWDGRSSLPKLREGQMAYLGRGMARAIQQCHRKGIMHRDVKTTNFAIGSDGEIKLIDFGFAFQIKEGKLPKACVGTAEFWAPEVGQKDCPYNLNADVFALGSTFYHLLTGKLPRQYKAGQGKQLVGTACGDELLQVKEEFKHLPDLVQDLLRRMMKLNATDRISIDEVLVHPWLNVAKNEALRSYVDLLDALGNKGDEFPWLHDPRHQPVYRTPTVYKDSASSNVQERKISTAFVKNSDKLCGNTFKKQLDDKSQQKQKKSSFYKVGKIAKHWWSKLSGSRSSTSNPKLQKAQTFHHYNEGINNNINNDSKFNKLKGGAQEYYQFCHMKQAQKDELGGLLPPILKGRSFQVRRNRHL